MKGRPKPRGWPTGESLQKTHITSVSSFDVVKEQRTAARHIPKSPSHIPGSQQPRPFPHPAPQILQRSNSAYSEAFSLLGHAQAATESSPPSPYSGSFTFLTQNEITFIVITGYRGRRGDGNSYDRENDERREGEKRNSKTQSTRRYEEIMSPSEQH
jgi:hypothetical protein